MESGCFDRRNRPADDSSSTTAMWTDRRDVPSIRPWLRRLALASLIGVGAVGGANLRFALGAGLPGLAGTLTSNVTGSLLLGILLYEARIADRLSTEARLLLGTGVLSSYTTYSTFVLDAVTAPPLVALAYVVGSYGLGLAGVLLGHGIARALGGRPA